MKATLEGGLDSNVARLFAPNIFINNLDDDIVGLLITFANGLELVGKAICWMAKSESKNISMGQI